MKRIIAIVCALVLACCAAAAAAAEEAPVSNLYKASTPETLKALIGGKSFDAGIAAPEFTGEDEDAKLTVLVTIYERDRFNPEAIDQLAVRDIVSFSNGTTFMAMEVVRDEYGVMVTDGSGEGYSFFKDEDGNYIATTDTDYPFWAEVCSIKVPVGKDVVFLDWSDPENLEEPVKLGYDEFVDCLLNGTSFTPNNTKLTFDENGKLVEILYNYSPWN